MTTLAQAVADLIAAPRPILFLDTCTLLDIVRAPLRDLTAAVQAGVDLRAQDRAMRNRAIAHRAWESPVKPHSSTTEKEIEVVVALIKDIMNTVQISPSLRLGSSPIL